MNKGPINWPHLKKLAHEVRLNAYAPYSHFYVGAALLAESGRVYVGANVENASYGLTLCAERSALSSAVAAGERHFLALVVVGGWGGKKGSKKRQTRAIKVIAPCGACRQALFEFDSKIVVMTPADGMKRRIRLDQLLRGAFRLSSD